MIINASGIICAASETEKELVDPFKPININEDNNKEYSDGLRLTAIVFIKDRRIALAEDKSGKGYILEINKDFNGERIIEILADRIIVERRIKNVSDKISVKKIEIMLYN